MGPLHLAVLSIIGSSDGMLSWYQIDRALSHREAIDGSWPAPAGLMPVLRELQHSGCITASAGPNPAQAVYSITQAGLHHLELAPADRLLAASPGFGS